MSSKTSSKLEALLNTLPSSRIESQSIVREVEQSFLDYSLSVITSRALPDLKDGLKPVHRRILYSAYEEKLFNDRKFKKSATLVGAVMGAYHPHGDSSIYGALVRLSQDFSLRYPLLEGQGNFGSIDGDAPAAMRYTEIKMSKLGEKFLEGIKEDTVDFVSNYDGSKVEPVILPTIVPAILLNGCDGIAVGMASNIPSHNLREVCDGAIALLEKPDLNFEELFGYIKGPDFPTGGELLNLEGVKRYLKTGRGSFQIRAKVELDQLKNQIIIKEIPYGVKKSHLIKRIAKLASEEKTSKHKVIPILQRYILNMRDESNLDEGIRLIIECRKDAPLSSILNNLYKNTYLQKSFTANLTILDGGEPKLMNVLQILGNYLKHQFEMLVRQTKFNLEKLVNRIHLLEGRKMVIDHLDEVIHIIREDESPASRLSSDFSLSETQVKDILDLPLKSLMRLEVDKLIGELNEKYKDRLAHIERLENRDIQREIIKRKLEELKEEFKYDSRKTYINESERGHFGLLDLIPREMVVINMSTKGFISALPLKTFKLRNKGGSSMKIGEVPLSGDPVKSLLISSTHDDLLVFTNLGRVYRLKTHDIKISSNNRWDSKPSSFKNLLQPYLLQEESVIEIVTIEEGDYGRRLFLFFATSSGIVKKTSLDQFRKINRRGKIVLGLKDGDQLKFVIKIGEDSDILLGASSGRAVRFNSSKIRAMSRSAIGVKGIDLLPSKKERDEGYSASFELISASSTYEGEEVLSIDSEGKGKLTHISQFRLSERNVKGVKAYKFRSNRVHLFTCTLVRPSDEIILMTNKNGVNRFKVDQIPRKKGRNTMGVYLMKMSEKGERLSNFTKHSVIETEEEV